MSWCNRSLIHLHCHFGLCLTQKEFERGLADLNMKPQDWPSFVKHKHADATTHIFEYSNKVCILVCMANWHNRDPVQIAGLLVHEAVHIWQNYCDHIGEDKPSIEFEAYSIQTIAQELMEAFKRQSVGRRRRKKGE